MEAVLIDTSILIGRFRREPRAMAALERIGDVNMLLCDAIVAEVLAGTRNKKEYAITKGALFGEFQVLPMTMEVTQCFRSILDDVTIGREVHFADQLIAATAIAHNVPLLTMNSKHFKGIKGLRLA
jgi:predicted nucleic acid-binding protein